MEERPCQTAGLKCKELWSMQIMAKEALFGGASLQILRRGLDGSQLSRSNDDSPDSPLCCALSFFHSVARGRHTEGFQHFLFVEEKLLPGASLLWTARGITRGITNVQEGRTSKNKKITWEKTSMFRKCGRSDEISIISQRHTCQGSVH